MTTNWVEHITEAMTRATDHKLKSVSVDSDALMQLYQAYSDATDELRVVNRKLSETNMADVIHENGVDRKMTTPERVHNCLLLMSTIRIQRDAAIAIWDECEKKLSGLRSP